MKEIKVSRPLPALDLAGVALLIVLMALFLFYDPFNISHHIIDFLRLNYPFFVQEPKLLICVSIYIGTFIFKAVTVAFILLFLTARKAGILKSLGLKMPSPKMRWPILLIPFVMIALGIRMYYFSDPFISDLPIRFILPESMLLGNIIMLVSTVIAAPIMEELIFRGYVYGVLERSFGYIISIGATSAIFALIHLQHGSDVIGMSLIFMLGLALGILRYKSDSVFVPIIFHAAYNFTFLAAGIIKYFICG